MTSYLHRTIYQGNQQELCEGLTNTSAKLQTLDIQRAIYAIHYRSEIHGIRAVLPLPFQDWLLLI